MRMQYQLCYNSYDVWWYSKYVPLSLAYSHSKCPNRPWAFQGGPEDLHPQSECLEYSFFDRKRLGPEIIIITKMKQNGENVTFLKWAKIYPCRCSVIQSVSLLFGLNLIPFCPFAAALLGLQFPGIHGPSCKFNNIHRSSRNGSLPRSVWLSTLFLWRVTIFFPTFFSFSIKLNLRVCQFRSTSFSIKSNASQQDWWISIGNCSSFWDELDFTW